MEKQEYRSFELEVQVRDKHGNPTGKTKTIRTNNASEIAEFWEKNSTPEKPKAKKGKKRKRGKKKKEYVPNAKEAESILKKLYNKKEQ